MVPRSPTGPSVATRSLLLLALAGMAVALLLRASPSSALSFSVLQLTNDATTHEAPDVSGHYVVWDTFIAGGPNQIFQYDGSQVRQITSDNRSNVAPRSSGPRIAWASGDPGTYATGGTSYYDGTNVSQILPANTYASYPDISGQTIVYTAPGTYDPTVPASYGSADVYQYSGGSVQNVTNDIDDEAGARIDGSRMVWMQHGPNGGGWAYLALGYGTNTNPYTYGKGGEIVLDDAGTVSVLSSAGQNAFSPSVSSSAVSWTAWDGTSLQIYVYRNGQTTQITHDTREDRSSAVSDNGVAWTGWDGSDYQIYYYDFATDSTTQLTSDPHNHFLGGISGRSLTWQGFDGSNWQIYLATVPEPSPVLLLGLGLAALAGERRRA